jgi:hypothetical protein
MLMTVKAPAHILAALRLSCHHFSYLSMAGLTANFSGNVRLVVEMDKIRLDGNRYPGDIFSAGHERGQFIQFGRYFYDLLVTSPAFRGSW